MEGRVRDPPGVPCRVVDPRVLADVAVARKEAGGDVISIKVQFGGLLQNVETAEVLIL